MTTATFRKRRSTYRNRGDVAPPRGYRTEEAERGTSSGWSNDQRDDIHPHELCVAAGVRDWITTAFIERKRPRQEHAFAKFIRLRDKWINRTRYVSSASDIIMDEAYQCIIGMGKDALPHILHELKTKPAPWFWALHVITEENPVPESANGDWSRMASYWLDWGRRSGYGF